MSYFPSFPMLDHEFGELFWENGQIVTHDYSSKPIKNLAPAQSPCRPSRAAAAAAVNHKAPAPAAPPPQLEGAQGDDMVPWIECAMDDPLQNNDFSLDFLEEYAPANVSAEAAISGKGAVRPLSQQQCVSSVTATAPVRTADAPAPVSTPIRTNAGAGVMNFSLFSRRVVDLNSTKSTDAVPGQCQSARALSGPKLKAGPDEPQAATTPAVHKAAIFNLEATTNALSSACSISSTAVEAVDPKSGTKRKSSDREESSSNRSDDPEDESVVVRRPASLRRGGAKRTRAAEVHNLSERRRRERINEKMRALQELIPNCNKTDKASMLDDAIEYLKSLQLQVQMMSVGGPMYMPPAAMALRPGMQHMCANMPMPPMAAVGLGPSTGYVYGFHSAPGCQIMPMPPQAGGVHQPPAFLCPATIPGGGVLGAMGPHVFSAAGSLPVIQPSSAPAVIATPLQADAEQKKQENKCMEE